MATVVLSGILVFVLILVWALPSPGSGSRETKNCGEVQGAQTFTPVEPHFLLPRSGQNLLFSWTFADVDRPYEDLTRLNWASADEDGSGVATERPDDVQDGSYLDLSMTKLVNSGNSSEIPAEQIGYFAKATGDTVSVQMCVDARGVAPGVYTAALEFTDSSVKAAPIAVQMTVPYGDERVPLTFFILGALVALGLVMVRAWGADNVPVYTLVTALVLAIIYAAVEGPLDVVSDPGWGSAPTDFARLLFASMIAVLGFGALSDVVNRFRDRSSDTPDDPQGKQ